MEINYKEKVITKKVVTIEFSEEEALILQKIVGGNHEWRELTSGLYYGLRDSLGYDKCESFDAIHCQDIERFMILNDKDHPSMEQSRA